MGFVFFQEIKGGKIEKTERENVKGNRGATLKRG